MMVVGEDPIEVLSTLALDRIIAVHLKAYDPAYGRACHRYARGFVPLNEFEGTDRPVHRCAGAAGVPGWVLSWSRNSSHAEPIVSLERSAAWLRDRGNLQEPARQFDPEDVGRES